MPAKKLFNVVTYHNILGTVTQSEMMAKDKYAVRRRVRGRGKNIKIVSINKVR